MVKTTGSILGTNRPTRIAVLVLLLGFGLAIRLYDLGDLPLDFHPTRQLLSQLKARGMYFQKHAELPDWQRRMAIQQWKTKAEVEPEVFERVVALTYEFTGVQIWVARIYASVFWIVGAAFLFLLVRELFSLDAAFISAGYFLFWPYAVTASRSFQPDVLMVALMLCFWWAFTRWAQTESWFWTVAAGLAGGLAIYVKFVAAFFIIGAGLGLSLGRFGARFARRRQLWVMAGLGALPALLYVYYGVVEQGFLGQQFSGRFIPALLLSPVTFVQWAIMANRAVGALTISVALLGLLLADDKEKRSLLLGLWGAYLLFGMFFAYHVTTHDYYHLPLIAVTAVSLGPVVNLVMERLGRAAHRPWLRLAVVGICLYSMLSSAWVARSSLAAINYRSQAKMWSEIGDRLGHGPNVVALTQDYGSRLAFWGWQNCIPWPNAGDIEYRQIRGGSVDSQELFTTLTTGNKYFLVTDFEELARQPELEQQLAGFAVLFQGDNYVIFDLERPAGP